MTLWCCLRLHGGRALPLGLAVLLLPACVPTVSNTAASNTTSTSAPAVRSTVPVRVGVVHLETAQPASPRLPAPVNPRSTAVAAATRSLPIPRPSPSYVFAPPGAVPKILAITLSGLEVSSGETVSGTVETTSNVASVEARISGWSMSVPRTRIGHFEAAGQLPDIPFFLKGTYTLQVIARNAAGEQAERDIPITLR